MSNPVCTALGNFLANTPTTELDRPILDLCLQLSSEKNQHSSCIWRKWCEDASRHNAFNLLLQDPYTRDARTKPSGYPGDARTLDYVYLRSYGNQEVTAIGEALFAITTGVPIANAVRDRCKHLATVISERLAETAGQLAVTSVACGHARELDYLAAEVIEKLVFCGLDQDKRTVFDTSSRLASVQRRCEVSAIRSIISGADQLPESDLIYASGLFDYLDDRTAAMLIRSMTRALRPGGSVIIVNLTPANYEIAFMEAIMDWWMHYRDMNALEILTKSAQLNPTAYSSQRYSTSEERVAWLEIKRNELCD